MKVFLLLSAVLAVTLAEEKYTTKYDNVDVDEILKNGRLMDSYHKCVMDRGPCTPDGGELKATIADALMTGCSKCSEKQQAGAEKVMKFLANEKPDLWKELTDKYDPEGTYRQKYHKEAEEHHIKLQ